MSIGDSARKKGSILLAESMTFLGAKRQKHQKSAFKERLPVAGKIWLLGNKWISLWTLDGRSIARPLKLTFAAILILVIAVFVTSAVQRQLYTVDSKFEELDRSLKTLFSHHSSESARGLSETLLGISQIEELKQAFRQKNRQALLGSSSALFEGMHERFGVTHFSFHNKDLSNFLRVHRPSRFGDKIERITSTTALKTKRISSGLEFDSRGRFTLRTVMPWTADGQIIGFIELGKQIDRLIYPIERSLGVQVIEAYNARAVRDSLQHQTGDSHTPIATEIDAKKDENIRGHRETEKALNHEIGPADSDKQVHDHDHDHSGWTPNKKYLLFHHGLERVSEELHQFIEEGSASWLSRNLFVERGRIKRWATLPLHDAQERYSGKLVIIRDVTEEFFSFFDSLINTIGIVLALALIAWILFDRIILAMQEAVNTAHEQLEQQVDTRTKDLAASEQRLREAQEVAAIGNWDWNISTNEVHWSDEVFRIFGEEPNESKPTRRNCFNRVHRADKLAAKALFKTAFRTRKPLELDIRCVRPDGEIRHVSLQGRFEFSAYGKPVRMYGVIHDITDRERARQLSQRTAHILEKSLNEIYVFNADDFRFRHVNEGARRNLGYSMDELTEVAAWDIKPDYDEDAFRKLIKPLAERKKQLLNFQTVHQRKDGTQYPVDVHLQLYSEQEPPLYVAIINDISERVKQNAELRVAKDEAERLAYFDDLTGLPNRNCCKKDAEEKFGPAKIDTSRAVIHIDLDNFKRVNDTLGHAAGDALLKEVGRRIRRVCGHLGKGYRWGGDEFVLILNNDENVDLDSLCEELSAALSTQLTFGQSTIWPTASLGVARYPEDGDDFDSLMVYADLALYKAKESGRDSYHFFTKDMKAKIDEEVGIERELREALEKDQLFLMYQPQVNAKSLKVTGIEALIRWRHPEKGVISPGAFMHVVEATKLAPTVGKFVIETALDAARTWQDKKLEYGKVGVNLSPQHLKTGTLYDEFVSAMDKNGLSPENVAAEVLESVFLDDPHEMKIEVLEKLHNLGVHIELDDFGTGYASLSHLSALPIDAVKIDRSFVKQMLSDEKKAVVVKSVINLAKMLRINTICEGVETAEQMSRLKAIGDCSIQGYFIARPMPYDQVTDWLSASEWKQDLASHLRKAS